MTCDRALVISKGRIVAEESIKELTEEKQIRLSILKPESERLEEVSTALKSLVPVADLTGEEVEDEYVFRITCKGAKDARNAIAVKASEMNWKISHLQAVATTLEEVFGRLIKEEEGRDVASIVG